MFWVQIRNRKTGHVFSSKPKYTGYIRNRFYDDERNSKHIFVHIRAFLGELKSRYLIVDHINRDKTDNSITNLRWTTKKQQVNSDRSKCRIIGQPVTQYTMGMEEIKTWTNIITAADELRIDYCSISKVCKGKHNHAGEFR